jgi:hypothetical protein
MPKTYEVGMEFDSTVWVSVEADSEEEAQEKAESMFDPANYMEVITSGYWIPGDVELVDDGTEEAEE